MATTPNLAITHIISSQSQKEVTANTGFDKFDGAITDLLAKTVASSDITLTSAEALEKAYFRLTGAQGADINLIVPINKKFYIVEHGCTGGFTITVKTSAGTGIALVNGNTLLVYCDGTNVVQAGGGGTVVAQLITKRFAKEVSANGDNQIVAAVSAKKIRVFQYALQAHGTVNAKFTDGGAGTQKTILWKFQDREGVAEPNNGTMMWEGTANTDLTLNLSGAVTVSVEGSYTEES